MLAQLTFETWSPAIQYGFAGFSVLLLIVIVWLIKQLLKTIDGNNQLLSQNNKVIAGNTEAIKTVNETARDTRGLMKDIRDQLLSRPCLLPHRGRAPMPGEPPEDA